MTVIAGRPNFVADAGGAGLIRQEVHQGVKVLRCRNFRRMPARRM